MSKMVKLKGRKAESPKQKTQPESIHELLEQMEVKAVTTGGAGTGNAGRNWTTVRQVYDDFCSETSFTALSRIHKANHIYKRICWLVLCIAMVSWMTLQCYWLFLKYYSYPVEVKVEIKAVPRLEFPSVTICNLNALKASKMHRGPFAAIADELGLKYDDVLYDDYLKDFGPDSNEWEGNGTTEMDQGQIQSFLRENEFNKWDQLEGNDSSLAEQFYSDFDDNIVSSLTYSAVAASIKSTKTIKSFGHRKKDLIMSCSWSGMSCSPSNFTYLRNNKYGNCFTFNAHDSGQPALASTYAGPLMGLVLELNIEQNEYVAALSPSAGVRVTIHKRGTYPFPEDDGIYASPGAMTAIGLRKRYLERLPPPHAGCADKGDDDVYNYYTELFNSEYTKSTCLKACYQQTFIEKCGCGNPLFYVPENVTSCNFFSANESQCMGSECETILEECSTRCPTSCTETKYDYTVSMAQWPSREYSDFLNAKIQKVSSHFLDDDELKDSKNTLVKLEVYYKELIYESVQQQKAYESENLISDIGGQLGLWLGLSAITVGELVEFVCTVSRLVANKWSTCKKKGQSAAKPPPITKVQPFDG